MSDFAITHNYGGLLTLVFKPDDIQGIAYFLECAKIQWNLYKNNLRFLLLLLLFCFSACF